jgi:hypothetical protein
VIRVEAAQKILARFPATGVLCHEKAWRRFQDVHRAQSRVER